MCQADASTTLQDKVVFCHFSDNVISGTSRPKTLDMIGIRTALAENQRPFHCVIALPAAYITVWSMPLSEGIIIRESVEVLLGRYHLRASLALGVGRDLIFLYFSHVTAGH